MKKTILSRFLATALILTIIFTLLPDAAKVNAAAKPKAKETKVTLYTDSPAYSIALLNVPDTATIKYSSSNKKIVTVKKGKVTPKGVGTATVKVKVKTKKKTYTIKIKFTVKEPKVSQKPAVDYDALAKKRADELIKSLTLKTDTKLKYDENLLCKTADDIKANIVIGCKDSSIFHLYFPDTKTLSLIRSEQEYLDLIPCLEDLSFYAPTQYSNVISVSVSNPEERGLYSEEFAVACALSLNDISYLTSEEKELYDGVVSVAKKLKGKDEYTTVKNIHDFLVLSNAYPGSYSGRDVHTLYNALFVGSCVCDGYSKGFYFLCRANGIDCIIVRGTSLNSGLGKWESHAWNKVKINGKWYAMDVTWDDPFPDEVGRLNYNYFLITDKDNASSHKWDDTGLPVADSTDLGIVYEKYGSLPKVASESEAIELLTGELEKFENSNESTLEIKFLYDKISTTLFQSAQNEFSKYCQKHMCCGNIGTAYEGVGFFGYLYTITISI